MSLEWLSVLRRVLVEGLERDGLPLPVPREVCEGWTEPVERGERALYTSCMYQLAPAIGKAVEVLSRLGVTGGGLRARLAGWAATRLGGLLIRPDEEAVKWAWGVLRRIRTRLQEAGVDAVVLRGEPYSGALLYELGFVEDFARHARAVYRFFRERGVREVITVDPHTHHVLSRIYPRYVEGFDLKVSSYLDYVRPAGGARGRVAVHDSCLYARYLGKHGRVRELLDAAGVERAEDPYVTSPAYSQCCGGPVEAVDPALAGQVARIRLRALAQLSRTVVTACPICYANLSRHAGEFGVEIRDIAEYL